MSLLATSHLVVQFVAAEDPTQTKNAIFPEAPEIIYGLISFGVVAFLLFKFGIPAGTKAMAARTERIQKELDGADAALASAKTESEQIRQAKGDIDAERARIMAEAQAQAESVITDGRARIETEVADLEAKSVADIAAARGRVGDELRAEIARLSVAAVDQVVTGTLDDATHQRLIEDFISRVGASSPAGASS